MECIHSALRSRYAHNQQPITLLPHSVEANDKDCVCYYSEHSKRWRTNTVRSICLACNKIKHMTNYRTRHTHTPTHIDSEMCFYCHQWKHCYFVSRGETFENKERQLETMMTCVQGSGSVWLECTFKRHSCFNPIKIFFSSLWILCSNTTNDNNHNKVTLLVWL